MRKITIDFNDSETCAYRTLGFIGEHNATELVIIPPKEMTDNPRIKFFKLAFSTPSCAEFSENLPVGLLGGSTIEWSVPYSVTRHGTAALQLEAYGENGSLLLKSRTLHGLRFLESVNDKPDFNAVSAPIMSGVEVTATDTDGNATELIIYGDLPTGVSVNGSKLERITLHGMTEIPDGMCKNCTALREVEVIGSVLAIGENAFDGCSKLESITPFESLQHIGASAFYNCTALKAMPLPYGLESIGEKAFSGCAALTDIVLPESLSEVGDGAFAKTGITEIVIPCIPCSWGLGCFGGSSLERATVSEGVTELPEQFFYKCEELKSVDLSEGLTSIGKHVFYGCAIEEIQLPESLISLGVSAFNSCGKLNNVQLKNVQTIGNYAFSNCTALEHITLTDKLTSIGEHAFQYCGFSEMSIPDSVTSIGRNAFAYCKKLSAIKLSKNITSLPEQIFMQTAFTEFEIPDNIVSVGWYAFSNCYSLKSVTMGSGVTHIDTGVFSGCSKLNFVRMKTTSPPTLAGYSAFPYSSSAFEGIYVPKSEDGSVLEAYKSATNWKSSYLVDKIFEWEGEV